MKKISFIVLIILLICCMASCTNITAHRTYSTYSPTYTYKTPSPTENLIDKLDISFLDSNHSGDYYTLTYKVTNNSSYHTFSYVEVKISLLDSSDNVLTSDWTYAVGSEGLSSGDSQEFDIMIKEPSDGRVASFRWSILDYD